MFWFYLLLLIDAVFLQPIRLVVGILMRFLWVAPKVDTPKYTKSKQETFSLSELRKSHLDKNYKIGGDACKFIGMQAYINGENSPEMDDLISLCLFDGSIKRNLLDPYTYDVAFSTDMAAGLIFGLTQVYTSSDDEQSNYRKKLLTALFEKTTFSGFPLVFNTHKKGKELFGRSHLYRPWWVIGSEDILTALVWLLQGYRITGKKKYLFAYWSYLVLHLPTLLFACPDSQIWVKRIYGISPHNTHSKALVMYAGYLESCSLSREWGVYLFSRALKYINERHGVYNADISALTALITGNTKLAEQSLVLCSSVADKGTFECPKNTKYLSLFWPPEITERANCIQSPSHRGDDYIWERNPLKGYKYTDEGRLTRCLDLWFPVSLIKRFERKFGVDVDMVDFKLTPSISNEDVAEEEYINN